VTSKDGFLHTKGQNKQNNLNFLFCPYKEARDREKEKLDSFINIFILSKKRYLYLE